MHRASDIFSRERVVAQVLVDVIGDLPQSVPRKFARWLVGDVGALRIMSQQVNGKQFGEQVNAS
jgi:hypothetical protein